MTQSSSLWRTHKEILIDVCEILYKSSRRFCNTLSSGTVLLAAIFEYHQKQPQIVWRRVWGSDTYTRNCNCCCHLHRCYSCCFCFCCSWYLINAMKCAGKHNFSMASWVALLVVFFFLRYPLVTSLITIMQMIARWRCRCPYRCGLSIFPSYYLSVCLSILYVCLSVCVFTYSFRFDIIYVPHCVSERLGLSLYNFRIRITIVFIAFS